MANAESQFAVYLHESRVGRIMRRGDQTRFVLDEGYASDPNRFVLGLQFEQHPTKVWSAHLRLPAWFSNVLPEGELRKRIAAQRGVKVAREMELLAEVGHDLPGAVRVLPIDEPLPEEVGWDGGSAPGTSGGTSRVRWRFSLAGVALKFSMFQRGSRLTAPATGEVGDWILKLPDPQHPHVPSNEFATMKFAQQLGLAVPDVRLVARKDVDDVPDDVWGAEEWAYAIRRFDRGPSRRRIHIEDLAQVRNFYPDDKYAGSFETVAALIYRSRDAHSLREFARRLAFCILIENGDAHLKNWSLIYNDPRRPTLSPAYDLVSTFVYQREGQQEDLGLKFDGTRRFERVSPGSFQRLEAKLGTDVGLRELVIELADAARTQCDAIVQHMDRSPEMAERIQKKVKERAEQFLRFAEL